MEVMDLYPRGRKREQALIPVWKDTRYALGRFKKHLSTAPHDRPQGYDDLMIILMDYLLCKDESKFIDEINHIRNGIVSEFSGKSLGEANARN